MHYLTSNFNLLFSNSLWSKIKKNKVIIDKSYNNFYLSTVNPKFINDFNTCHILIYLSPKNYRNIFKKIKLLKKNIKRLSSKAFFIYFFREINLDKKTKAKSILR